MENRSRAHKKVLAYLCVVLLLVATAVFVSSRAKAYTPIQAEKSFGEPDGEPPHVDGSLKVSKEVVNPGDKINYTLDASFDIPPRENQLGKSKPTYLTITVAPDANAPFDKPRILTGDFKWSDGKRRVPKEIIPLKDTAGYQYVFELQEGDQVTSPLKVTANIPATVATDVDPGTEIKANAAASLDFSPFQEWVAPDPELVNYDADQCLAEYRGTVTFNGGGYGAWLAEIKLATKLASSVLSSEGPDIKITAPDGTDMTREVLDAAVFNPDDDSQPIDPNAANNSDFSYKQSLNFPLDIDTLTGKIWIPDGTKIDYSQSVKMKDCVPGFTSADEESYGFTVVTARNSQYVETPMEAVSVVPGVDPKFAVEKALSSGESSAVELKSGESEVAWLYDVTVSNVGDVDGKSAPVFDTPEVPAGFRVKSVEVDGQDVTDTEDAGKYTVSGDGVELAAGAEPKVFKVKVTYEVDQDAVAEADGWQDLGECQAATDGQEADPSKGVYNLVTMDGDLDEPGVVNNDECVTVTKHDEPPVSSTTSSVPSSTATPVVPPVSSTTAPAPSLTTTPAVPSAVPTPEPAPEEPARGPLAQTGANIKEMIAFGVLLALVGLMLVVRRRRED